MAHPRNHNRQKMSTLWRTGYYPNGSTIGPSDLGVSVANRDIITFGAMVRGDHVLPNPFSFDSVVVQEPSGTCRYGVNPVWVDEGSLLVTPYTNAFLDSERQAAYSTALKRLNEKVDESVDLTETLAQRSQLFRMLNATDKLISFTKSIKRSVGKTIGSLWLEYQYGWQPLLSDIYDSAQILAFKSASDGYATFKARASKPYIAPLPAFQTYSGDTVKVTSPMYSRSAVEIGVTLNFDGKQLDLDSFATRNPLRLAWNLLPYSFVVDWFWDLGGYMEAAETAIKFASRFHSGYVTNLDVFNNIIQYKGPGVTVKNHIYDVNGACKFIRMKRTVLTGYPLQRFPVPSVNLGSGRLYNAAALLSQFLGRR